MSKFRVLLANCFRKIINLLSRKRRNRLKWHRCYLVGPMDHNREAGIEWRKDMMDFLMVNCGVLSLNPYEKPMLKDESVYSLEDDDSYGKRKAALQAGNYDKVVRITKPLRAVDLRLVDASDFIIVNLDIDNKPCGTYEELFTANRQKKPVIIYCKHGKKKIPDWLFGTVPHQMMFEKWDDVKKYINHIDKDKKINTFNRWRFFDWEPQINRVLSLET